MEADGEPASKGAHSHIPPPTKAPSTNWAEAIGTQSSGHSIIWSGFKFRFWKKL